MWCCFRCSNAGNKEAARRSASLSGDFISAIWDVDLTDARHAKPHRSAGHSADFSKTRRLGKKTLRDEAGRGVLPARPRGWNHLFPITAMAYAVIKTGGKQYRVQQGTRFDVEKLDVEENAEIQFDALLVGEGESLKIGTPTVEGASVTVKVLRQFRGPKGVAFKFKRRKGFHKTKGFRRSLTQLEVTSIRG
jgi:large subunit ribosomal protein L21